VSKKRKVNLCILLPACLCYWGRFVFIFVESEIHCVCVFSNPQQIPCSRKMPGSELKALNPPPRLSFEQCDCVRPRIYGYVCWWLWIYRFRYVGPRFYLIHRISILHPLAMPVLIIIQPMFHALFRQLSSRLTRNPHNQIMIAILYWNGFLPGNSL